MLGAFLQAVLENGGAKSFSEFLTKTSNVAKRVAWRLIIFFLESGVQFFIRLFKTNTADFEVINKENR